METVPKIKVYEQYQLPDPEGFPINQDTERAVSAGSVKNNTIYGSGDSQQSSNYVPGVSGWYLDNQTGEFNFAVSVDAIDIPDTVTANSFHTDSSGNSWWGATTFGAAAASISKAGAGIFSNLTVTGGSISGVPISAIPNNSSTDISLLGWQSDLAFSSTDFNTAAWTSGTITLSNGRTFSISSGNTGNMAAISYIYLDTAVSTTVLQITTTAATAIGANKILVAVAQNNSDSTGKVWLQAFGGKGGIFLTVDNLAANSSSVNEFVANTANIKDAIISNAKVIDLAVSKLTAGTITSKSIVLAISDGTGDVEMRAGIATGDFDNTGAATGFIFGMDDSDSNKVKFYWGDPTHYVKWDGTTLSIVGSQFISKPFTAKESLSAGDAVRLCDGSTTHLTETNDQGSDAEFGNNAGGAQYLEQAMPFTIPTGGHIVTSIVVKVKRASADSNGIFIAIESDSAGLPSGTVKGTSSTVASATVTSSYTDITFTFTSDVNLASGTYWAVMRRVTPASGTCYTIATNSSNSGSTNHARKKQGAGWLADLINVWYATVVGNDGTAGQVKKASGLTAFSSNVFIGFAQAAISAAAQGNIIISGNETTSGLTANRQYYLSDTAGAISTTAGTVTRKVGLSLSTTELLITNIW